MKRLVSLLVAAAMLLVAFLRWRKKSAAPGTVQFHDGQRHR